LVTRLEIAVTSTDSALQAAVGAAKPGEARLLVRLAAITDEEDFVHGWRDTTEAVDTLFVELGSDVRQVWRVSTNDDLEVDREVAEDSTSREQSLRSSTAAASMLFLFWEPSWLGEGVAESQLPIITSSCNTSTLVGDATPPSLLMLFTFPAFSKCPTLMPAIPHRIRDLKSCIFYVSPLLLLPLNLNSLDFKFSLYSGLHTDTSPSDRCSSSLFPIAS
jgi:hypothetical protein